jgi:hypothetical protein
MCDDCLRGFDEQLLADERVGELSSLPALHR